MPIPSWKLSLLGRFELEHEGRVCERFGGRLDEQLVAFVALHAPSAVGRKHLAGRLWPHMDDVHARKQVSYYLFQARKRLTELGLAEGIETVRLNLRLSDEVAVDALEFAELLGQAVRCTDEARQTQLLDTAIALYGAGLLPQLGAAWVEPHREQFERLYRLAVRALADPIGRAKPLRELTALLPSVAWQAEPSGREPAHQGRAASSDGSEPDLVQFSQAAEAGLTAYDTRAEWLARVQARLPELQHAAQRAGAEGRHAQAAAMLAPLWRYWFFKDQPGAGVALLQPVLAAGYEPADEEGAQFLHALGTMSAYAGDLPAAEQHLQRAIALWDACGKPRDGLRSRTNLGLAYYRHGDFPRALAVLEDCIGLARALGDVERVILASLDAAKAAVRCQDTTGAMRHLLRHRRLLEGAHPPRQVDIAQNLALASGIHLMVGDLSQAEREATEAQGLFQAAQHTDGMILAAQLLGRVAYQRGQLATARGHMERALDLARTQQSVWYTGVTLGYLATIAQAEGDEDRADELMADAKLLIGTIPNAGSMEQAQAEIDLMRDQGAQAASPGRAVA